MHVMAWDVEYYEQLGGTQPAEAFEDALDRRHPKLAGKLIRAVDQFALYGPQTGGGLIEACRNYAGIWEVRAIFSQTLARELFGFDGNRVVLLHGYVKRSGQEASIPDLERALRYWKDYQQTQKISPEAPDAADAEKSGP